MISTQLHIEKSDVHKLLLSANPDSALLYLFVQSGNDPEQAPEALKMSQSRYHCAAASLRQLGLWPEPKKVLVVGGGVAGMEAAIRAFDRGHKVILCEKTDYLGGMLFFTDVDTDKPDLKNFKDLLIREVGKRDIEVRLNTKVDAELIKSQSQKYLTKQINI